MTPLPQLDRSSHWLIASLSTVCTVRNDDSQRYCICSLTHDWSQGQKWKWLIYSVAVWHERDESRYQKPVSLSFLIRWGLKIKYATFQHYNAIKQLDLCYLSSWDVILTFSQIKKLKQVQLPTIQHLALPWPWWLRTFNIIPNVSNSGPTNLYIYSR